MIALTVYGLPAPQGSTKAFMRRGMRHPIVTADCARTKPWRQAIVDVARQELRGRAPAEGPLSLGVTFYLPRPKSAPRRVVEPATRPDLDKLLRALCDALTAAGVWRDDAQLVHVVARKVFAGGVHDDEGEAGVPRAMINVQEVVAW